VKPAALLCNFLLYVFGNYLFSISANMIRICLVPNGNQLTERAAVTRQSCSALLFIAAAWVRQAID
jgi:hypothetical protein